MTRTIISLSSPTLAGKAARELQRNGIRAGTTRLHPSASAKGCTAGVEVPEAWLDTALVLLAKAGISYNDIVYLP